MSFEADPMIHSSKTKKKKVSKLVFEKSFCFEDVWDLLECPRF